MNLFPRNEIDDLIDNSTEIKFQITDWFIPETDKNRSEYEANEDYTIYIYGTNNEGVTICTKVINFQPFFYVKPPNSWELLDDKKFKLKIKEFETHMREGTYESRFKGGKVFNKRIISIELEP